MIDFLLDEDNDIQFDANGELVFGESDMQDVALIFDTNPGDWKEDPIVGMGMAKYVKGKERNLPLVVRELKKQLARDGKDYERIKNKIKIELKTD